jgi:predicted helicase
MVEELRPHQLACKNAINEHFKTDNKGLIKMFCGAGKSYII